MRAASPAPPHSPSERRARPRPRPRPHARALAPSMPPNEHGPDPQCPRRVQGPRPSSACPLQHRQLVARRGPAASASLNMLSPRPPRPLPPPAPLRPSGAPFFLLLHRLLCLHSPSSPQRPSGFGLRCHAAYARACGLSSRPLRDRVGGRAQDDRAWPAHSGPNASPEPDCSSRPLPGWAPCRGPAVTLPSTVPGGV